MDILYSLSERDDFDAQIVAFIELLVKANKRRPVFDAPSFFAELSVVHSLLEDRGDVVLSWQSSGNFVFDIISSEQFPAVEVKSTTSTDTRIHTLSLHQIRYFLNNPDSLLASVQVSEDPEGITCRQLSVGLKQRLLELGQPGVDYIDALLVSLSNLESFSEHKFCPLSTTALSSFYLRF